MGEVLCPYCKASLHESSVIRCTLCSTAHHRVCWLEYGNHCSVFSCRGAQPFSGNRRHLLLPLTWCVMNYGFHLALRWIGEMTSSIPVPDVFIVATLEFFIIATGWLALKSSSAREPVRTIGILLFSGNALFVSLLFSHLVSKGFESLNSFIRL